ncbi:hypothetical protein AMS68_003956 [Peltaster fructicola]|uniref:TPR-like protein n=1 Tax=Peltaster fructicola TaxID=286661 RepID=A0A6H0XUY4_9PEZI|nr:hypothetical protein AMS68_003956 [Peltaster fructicola]
MAPAQQNGHTNGTPATSFKRFQDIPNVIDIPVRGEEDEAVNLDLLELADEVDELCGLLEAENAAKAYWITIALAYAKQRKIDTAIDIIRKGLAAQSRGKAEDKLALLTVLCWLQLWQARHVARVAPEGAADSYSTKDTWLQAATGTLNEASRINPSYPPLFLARGVLSLLRAPLLTGKTGVGSSQEALTQAMKGFDDALRHTQGSNIMALLGRARTLYSLGKYAESLQLYQKALESAPDLLEPDPRIGIGCCLWQLGHKEHANAAWERALELNQDSAIAHQLVALHYLDQCSHHSTSSETFGTLYKKAMTVHTQSSFKINDMQPLTCATFGSYFLLRKQWQNVDKLAKRAVELTDTATIASDGWYLRARQAHYQNDTTMAADCYAKSDQARGGDEKGYAPAKFGAAQLRTLQKDYDGAKFRLEKMLAQGKSVEVQTLLGMLYAEDVFSNTAATREEQIAERRKAIALLEQVRTAWRDTKRNLEPDTSVLLTLARLYEGEAPEKSLGCLLQVEQIELDGIDEEDKPEGIDDVEEQRKAMRELISPQLLNNIACFQFQAEKYAIAREYFQTALSACVKREDEPSETDALVTTISFNLARVYEAEYMNDEAKNVYTSLLQRHPDYTDASLRLAYIALNDDPATGVTAIKALLDADPGNLEVRTMYGWYVNKSKKKTLALNEDQEQRHYKQTLQTYDKHDLYALTGMGNVHLAVAREMPRQTDQDKERRSKVYMRAVEFFDKVLTLDPRNAYAAQGMGIALVEDKKDRSNAMQIFSKVRETVKDASVFINLGHVFADSGQFARSIENYEAALSKLRSTDPQQAVLLACLGRVWYTRGKAERTESRLESYKTSLGHSQRAIEAAKGAKDEVNYRFNVAFIQMQIAQLVINTGEVQRTVADVQAASQGLDEAIETFGEIAQAPNPPFPREIIEQRANMGRNTMKRQLGTALEKQEEYERKNQTRLEEARRRREEEIRRREEEKRKAEEEVEARRRKIREERERMMEEEQVLIQQRIEEEKAREEAELTTDEATGERKKREKKRRPAADPEKRKKRKKKSDDSEDDLINDSDEDAGGKADRSSTAAASGSEDEQSAPKRKTKKRRLEKKSAAKPSKYKSSEMVEDSSEDDADAAQLVGELKDEVDAEANGDQVMEDDEVSRPKVRRPARVLDDEDEDGDE